MRIINPDLLQRADRFFQQITPADRIALLHDTDPDGTTSGKIIVEAITRLGGKISLYVTMSRGDHSITNEIITTLQKEKITKLITTDKTIDSGPEQLKKVERFAEICIFDHHIIENNVNSQKTILLKPQLLFSTSRPDQYCSAKLSYDVLNRVTDVSDTDWICVSGIIGDMAAASWKSFIEKVFYRHNLPLHADLFETPLGQITQLISYAEAMGEAEQCFDLILKAKSAAEALTYLSNYKIVKQEVEYYFNNYKSFVEEYPLADLIFLEIQSPYKIKSLVGSILAQKIFPQKTLVVVQREGSKINISARRNDHKMNMHDLLKKATQNLDGRAGGHAPAAGAAISGKQFPVFKTRLLKYAKEMAKL